MIVRRMMAALAVATFIVAALPVAAQSPFVRTSVSKASVTVGEPVTLVVEVFVPTWFSGAPQFPEIKVEGSIVTRSDQTLNLSERFDYETWAGQRREYSVIPLRPGTLTIAPFDVTVRYALEGAKPSDPTPVSTKAIEIAATIPPEAEGLETFIASTRLTVEETWGPKGGEMKAGDSVTRVVTMRAVNVPSILLPLTAIGEAVDGVAVYSENPATRDEGGERGSVRVGTRIERVTYVFEKEGEYTFAPVAVSWWDPVAGKVKVSSTKETVFAVAPNPDLVPEIPPPPPVSGPVVRPDRALGAKLFVEVLREGAAPLALNVLLGVLLSWVLIRIGRWLGPIVANSIDRWRTSEAAIYRQFVREAQSGDPRRSWEALRRWRARAGVRRETAVSSLVTEMERLDQVLFGTGGPAWDSGLLLAAVNEQRKPRSQTEEGVSILPPLNPRRSS